MPTWPSTLPQEPDDENYAEGEPSIVIRSETDAGVPLLRRRYTAGLRPFSFTMTLDESIGQVSALRSFFANDVAHGALAFDFPDPLTGSTISVRFSAPPAYSSMGGTFFRAAIAIEKLP